MRSGVCESIVRPSVCLFVPRRAAGLLLSAVRAGDVGRQRRRRARHADFLWQTSKQQVRAVSRLQLLDASYSYTCSTPRVGSGAL